MTDLTHVRITKIDGMSPVTGTKIEIDGQEMNHVRSVQFHHQVGHVPLVELEVMAYKPFELEVDAKVTINLLTYPGSQIVDVTNMNDGEGTRRLVVTFPENIGDQK